MIQYMIIGMKMGSCMVEENQIKSLLKLILIKLIVPQVQAKGVDPTKPTSTLVYHPAKYKEMPTAKKISIPKQEEETIWERGKQLINLVGNGLSRKLQLFFDSEPEHTSKRIKISNKKVTKNKRRENLEIEISPNYK